MPSFWPIPPPSSSPRNARQFTTKPEIALVVGRASWWTPSSVRSKNKRQKKITFAAALKDFLQHVSFHCYGKLVEPGRRFEERLLWLVVHITALTLLIIFFVRTFHSNYGQSLATTIFNPLYPVQEVAFPAVAICTLNRISNAAAMRYAMELNAKDPEKRGATYFYDRIYMLGYNYYSRYDSLDFEGILDFQRFLDIYDLNVSDMFFNTRNRIKMLTPRCNDILIECRLGGHKINCNDEFQLVSTARGFCCAFNHDGRYSKPRTFNMRLFGPDMGLVVLLNASRNDYYDRFAKIEGVATDFQTFIYDSKNFPDTASGAVRERFIPPSLESYMKIESKVLQTVKEARILSPKMRKCYFDDDMPRVFGKEYTFNKCITRCRTRSILVLCNCLHFIYPYEYLDADTDTVYCTLHHIECLRRYDFKWANVITHRENVMGLEREMEDALYCPDCLPLCSETFYSIYMAGLPLNRYNMRTFDSTIDADTAELALLRVFFGQPNVKFFRQILQDSWFEIVSFIGNICSIITGFSLIGFCEVLYFFTKQLYTGFKEEASLDRNRKVESKEKLIILP